jgi:hypothetical protein
MEDTACAGRRLSLGVRAVHACPTSRPVAYIAAPAEAPACPSSPCPVSPPSHAVRRNREAPPPAVLHPPAVESRRRNRRHQLLCEVELDLRRPRPSTGKHRSAARARRTAASNAPPPAAPTEIRPPPLISARGEHVFETLSISSLYSTTRLSSWMAEVPAIGATRAATAPPPVALVRPGLRKKIR